jgi:hypothetical protein
MRLLVAVVSGALCVAEPVSAQIVVDGTADAGYGPALSIQNTDTQFINSTNPDPRQSNGSEIDQVFGKIHGGRLYLLIAGNLESNFSRLEVFIDSVAGGVNTINGAALPTGVDAFCCGGLGTTDGALQRMNGLTFDSGFGADYYVTVSNGTVTTGGSGATGWLAAVDYAVLNQGTAGAVVRAGGVLNAFGNELNHLGVSRGLPLGTLIDQNNNLFNGLGTDIALHEVFEPWNSLGDPTNSLNHRDMQNTVGMLMAVNQTNTVGVNGGNGVTTGNPHVVTTGIELSLPLTAIGSPTGDIRVTAFINGAGHNFVSNQFSGQGVLQPNFGFLPPNLATEAAGNQFVTITQPATLDGDLNGDGFVGIADLNIVLGNWNLAIPPGDPLADPSGDNFVGIADLNVVLGNWNAGTPPVDLAAIPEPATATLALGLLIALIPRRSRVV